MTSNANLRWIYCIWCAYIFYDTIVSIYSHHVLFLSFNFLCLKNSKYSQLTIHSFFLSSPFFFFLLSLLTSNIAGISIDDGEICSWNRRKINSLWNSLFCWMERHSNSKRMKLFFFYFLFCAHLAPWENKNWNWSTTARSSSSFH